MSKMRSRIACVFHEVDLDGWMSAAIVKHWFQKTRENYVKSKVFKEVDVDFGALDFIGYNYGQPIPDLSKYDKVIVCDISLPIEEMENLRQKLQDRFIWLDHHISAIKTADERTNNHYNGIRDIKFAACELTWKYFFPDFEMPEIVRLLGRYDCFGHKNTNEEQKVLEFQYGARTIISNYKEAYKQLQNCIIEQQNKKQDFAPCEFRIWENGKSIYKFLCADVKQSYKNGFEIELYKPIEKIGDVIHDEENKTSIQVGIIDLKPYKFICINKERFNPINFGIDYHSEGYDGTACFHYANGKYNFSLYNDNGLVDCSIIAKSFGGGGHKGAAGFILTQEQFSKLVHN